MSNKRNRRQGAPQRPFITASRSDTSGTAGGGPRKPDSGTSIPILTEGLEGVMPEVTSAVKSPASWNPQTVAVVVGSVITALGVAYAAVTMSQDMSSIDEEVSALSDDVGSLSSKTVEMGVKIDGIQSSLSEVRRDIRDDRNKHRDEIIVDDNKPAP